MPHSTPATGPHTGIQPRVFISYARSDGEEFAKDLREKLDAEGLELWRDRDRMEGGVGWWKQITAALDVVEFMVLVVTPNAMASKVVTKEWRYARQQGVCVFPVQVPGKPIDFASLPHWMADMHFYDLNHEWETFVNYLKNPCHAVCVPFMARDLQADFVPRDEQFKKLKAQLLDPAQQNPVAITTSLVGAGGFGKTTLALALCHDEDIQTAFNGGILWATLGENSDVQTELTVLYRALTGDKSAEFASLDEARRNLTEKLAGADCLIVIDDVWNSAHLKPFLEGGPRCARLITTRLRGVAVDAGAERVDVDMMTDDEALAMLISGVHPPDLVPFRELIVRLGYWPLMLELANGALQRQIAQGRSLDAALTWLLVAMEKRGVTAFDVRNATERNQAVVRSMAVSLELLNDTERKQYLTLGIFPEDTEIPLTTLAALWGLEEFDADDLTAQFAGMSLLKYDMERGFIRLHDVVRAYLSEQLTDMMVYHARLIDNWGDALTMPDDYAWRWAPYHLVGAGRQSVLRDLLLNAGWLRAKLDHTDLAALISDFDYIPDAADLRMVQDALRLSAHVLLHDSSQLGGQLRGRLLGLTEQHPALDTLLTGHQVITSDVALLPQTASLQRPGGALRLTLRGHTGAVRAVTLTGDGRAVSASSDGTLRVWDLDTGAVLHTLEGHTNAVRAVTLTEDGRVVSASSDGTLKVWDLDTGALLHTLKGHSDWVRAVALTGDGRVVSASEDGTLRVWNLDTGAVLHILEGHITTVIAVALTGDGRAVSASGDSTLRVWNLDAGALLFAVEAHEGSSVRAVALTGDGRVVSASKKGALRVWDLDTGALLHTLKGHGRAVMAIALTGDGRVVSASDDSTLKVWDLDTGALLHTLEGHSEWVRAVTLTGDGRVVSASDDGTLKVWDLDTGTLLHTLKGHGRAVMAVTLTGDGQAVSASDDGTLKVWDLDTGALLHTKDDHRRVVRAITLTGDGQAVSASDDGTLKVWDLDTGALLHTLEGHTRAAKAVALTGDGRAVSASSGGTLKVWDLDTGALLRTLKSHSRAVMAMTLTGDGRVVSASKDGTLKVWDLDTGVLLRTLKGHNGYVLAVALTGDGRVVSASKDGTLKVWHLNTGAALRTLKSHSRAVMAMTLTGDGRVVSVSADGTLKVWDLDTGTLLHTLEGHNSYVFVVTLTRDGRAVSASADGTLKVWDLNTGAVLHTLGGHGLVVKAITLTRDGRAVSTSADGTLKVWNLDTGACLATFTADSSLSVCAVAVDGLIITAGASGHVHFLRLVGLD